MGVATMRWSDLTLTPALTGLVMVALLVVGAIAVRVVTASDRSEVRTQVSRESVGQGGLNQGTVNPRTMDRSTPQTGITGLRGTLE